MTNRRQFIILSGAGALFAGRAAALSTDQAQGFVRDLVDRLTTIVEKSRVGQAREDQFLALLREKADLPAVGRFVTGLAWRQMSEVQKSRFMAAFEGYAVRVYAGNVSRYAGQTIEIDGARDLGARGVLVNSRFLQQGKKPLDVGWLVSDRSGAAKLIDVIAAGVSVSVSQREQFAGLLNKTGGDVDAFIAAVEGLNG